MCTRRVALLVESESILGDELECHTLDTSGSTSEASIDDGVINTESFEDLSTLVDWRVEIPILLMTLRIPPSQECL